MTDYTDLQKAAEYAAQDTIKFADEDEEMRALQQFHEEVNPETVLALIAENQALKGPHDWLAEDLIKELVDNAQAFQENSDHGENDPFAIVLLAAASRIRRQEANIDKQRAQVAGLKTGYEAYERVNAELKQKVANLEVCQTASLGMSGIIKCVAGELGFDAAGEDSAQDYLIGLASKASEFKAENERLESEAVYAAAGFDAAREEVARLKAENEALRREREGKVICDLELFETLRDSANTEADEHRKCMATYRPLRQESLDSVVKKCDDLLAAMGKGELS